MRGYSLSGQDMITLGAQTDTQGATCPSDPTTYYLSSAVENQTEHYIQTAEAYYAFALQVTAGVKGFGVRAGQDPQQQCVVTVSSGMG